MKYLNPDSIFYGCIVPINGNIMCMILYTFAPKLSLTHFRSPLEFKVKLCGSVESLAAHCEFVMTEGKEAAFGLFLSIKRDVC